MRTRKERSLLWGELSIYPTDPATTAISGKTKPPLLPIRLCEAQKGHTIPSPHSEVSSKQ